MLVFCYLVKCCIVLKILGGIIVNQIISPPVPFIEDHSEIILSFKQISNFVIHKFNYFQFLEFHI